MNIALVSLNQIWEDKELNIKECESYIEKASNNKADLIIFPEMTLTGFSMDIKLIGEKKESSASVMRFQKMAKMYNIAIVFGVVYLNNNQATNNLIFVEKSGKLIMQYAKIHPFTFSGEDKAYQGGNKIGLAQFNDYTVGLSICYDLRFPELYSALGNTSDFIINIANWPKRRVNHWHSLLKARAIENQLYCIGVNRTGLDGNGLEYEESSLIFNANGESLFPSYTYKLMNMFVVDLHWTKLFKGKFNTRQDRKVELYKKII